jgi:hypothetical protein
MPAQPITVRARQVPRRELSPHAGGRQAGLRSDDRRGADAHVDADGHRGEHGRQPEALRGHVGGVARQEGDRVGHERVCDSAAHGGDHPAGREADGDAPHRALDEVPARLPGREGAGGHGAEREPVGDERGGVVDEALALEDGHDAPRDAEALRDGHGGHGVGRPDDRSERERGAPRQAVQERVRDDRHARHGGQHETHGEQGDRAQVGAQIAQVREERAEVEQRRQEDDQDQVRLEPHVGQDGQHAHDRPAEHEQDGVGDLQAVGRGGQPGDRHQQRDDDDLDTVHGAGQAMRRRRA